MEQQLAEAARILRASRRVVAFTGAGMSRDSGIPTFRDEDGLWSRYPVERFGTVEGLIAVAAADPRRLVAFVAENFAVFLGAQPNAGHQALAALAPRFDELVIVTQNIDDLHERAGSRAVHKLHGDLFTLRCLACGQIRRATRAALAEQVERFVSAGSNGPLPSAADLRAVLPRCGCGGVARPDVVMFGEALPAAAWEAARAAVMRSACLLVIGSTVEVAPASLLPQLAVQLGVPLVEINPRPVMARAAVTLAGPAATVLPALATRLAGRLAGRPP